MGKHRTCVLWNAIPEDWARPEGWVDKALAQCEAQLQTLIVLHDLATGAMSRLEAFILRAKAQGMEFVQEFPTACVPIEQGRVVADVSSYVS